MRANMDPSKPIASTLDPEIARIYSQAADLRESLRQRVSRPRGSAEEETARRQRQDRTRQLARIVLDMPDRLRHIVATGKLAEANEAWRLPRQLLELWRERGLGGDAVQSLIEQGDAIVEGPDKSPTTEGVVEG